MGELTRELNNSGIDVSASPVSPEQLVSLLQLVEQGTISLKVAREIFPEVYSSGKTPEQIVQEKGAHSSIRRRCARPDYRRCAGEESDAGRAVQGR